MVLGLHLSVMDNSSIPVVARSKARFCGLWLDGIAGSNPARGHGCLSVADVVCCQVEVSGSG